MNLFDVRNLQSAPVTRSYASLPLSPEKDEEGEEMSFTGLGKIALAFRVMQLYAHNAHNECKGKTFFQDHAFLSDLYGAYTEIYDSLVERMLGREIPIDLTELQDAAGDLVPDKDDYFPVLLGMEREAIRLCEEHIRGETSQGTINLLAGIADSSEVRVYKLRQRLL